MTLVRGNSRCPSLKAVTQLDDSTRPKGRALAWYRWRDSRQPKNTWAEFRENLLDKFRGLRGEDDHDKYFALTQETIVIDYRGKFEVLAGGLEDISDVALGNFMSGLKPSIRSAVRVLRLLDLDDSMSLEDLVELRDKPEGNNRGARNFTQGDQSRARFTPTSRENPRGARD
ncbi:hypothetical protein QQ045_017588 [Rhodiola kirilowii]